MVENNDLMLYSDLAALPGSAPLTLAIGVFDGVHRGHRLLLDTICRAAAAGHAEPVAVTFDPHPRTVLTGDAPPLLLPLAERIRLLREAGMKAVIVIPFSLSLAHLAPEAFLDLLFSSCRPVKALAVGSCWRFGRNASGNTELLRQYAADHGWEFFPVPELQIAGSTVSTSAIRRAIAAGRLEEAESLLGRPLCWYGTVTEGRKIAGETLHCPTANVILSAGVLPPDGVYAGRVRTTEGQWHGAAFNIGFSPTYAARFGRRSRRIEAHLLDYSGNLYGEPVAFELFRYLRSEKTFADENELRSAIAADVQTIRVLLQERKEQQP